MPDAVVTVSVQVPVSTEANISIIPSFPAMPIARRVSPYLPPSSFRTIDRSAQLPAAKAFCVARISTAKPKDRASIIFGMVELSQKGVGRVIKMPGRAAKSVNAPCVTGDWLYAGLALSNRPDDAPPRFRQARGAGMTLLILGLILFSGAHLFKRLAPARRAAIGAAGKGLVALAVVAGIVLMVVGYRSAPYLDVWSPPEFLTHVNNLLMLIAVFLLGVGNVPGVVRTKMRHPMLGSVKVWALAHLLVNGDLASIVLFGGMLAWAVVNLILINKAEPTWQRPVAGPVRNDLIYGVVSLLLFVAITFVHTWLGVSPFG